MLHLNMISNKLKEILCEFGLLLTVFLDQAFVFTSTPVNTFIILKVLFG